MQHDVIAKAKSVGGSLVALVLMFGAFNLLDNIPGQPLRDSWDDPGWFVNWSGRVPPPVTINRIVSRNFIWWPTCYAAVYSLDPGFRSALTAQGLTRLAGAKTPRSGPEFGPWFPTPLTNIAASWPRASRGCLDNRLARLLQEEFAAAGQRGGYYAVQGDGRGVLILLPERDRAVYLSSPP